MDEIRLKKFKITSTAKISIQYEKKNRRINTWDEYSMTCADLPRLELDKALQGLRRHVVEMCELPSSYQDRIKVTGVSFSYGGEAKVMGATIISQMELENSNCGLNLNTPHKASGPYSDQDADPKQLLTDDCISALEELQNEIKLYINGVRAQTSLFAII